MKIKNKRVLAKWQQLLVFALILVLPVSAVMVVVVQVSTAHKIEVGSGTIMQIDKQNMHMFDYLLDDVSEKNETDINIDVSKINAMLIDFEITEKMYELAIENSHTILANLEYHSQEEYEQIVQTGWGGQDFKGTFASNDKGGINYLHNEMVGWGLLSGSILAAAAFLALSAKILSIPTGGMSLVVLGSLASLAAAVAPFVWGFSQMASNAMQDAIRIASSGKSYSVARNWGWFGIITGYSVW